MTVKRIGLFGNFGGGNIGNEGSLEAMLLFLKEAYPEAEKVCICAEPDTIHAQFGIPVLPVYTHRSGKLDKLTKIREKIADHIGVFRNVRNFDVLLIPGTGILDDFRERAHGFPYMIFLICLVARLRGINVAFVSTGAGPIHAAATRWLMKNAARMATYRSYRDKISKDFMTELGIDTHNDPIYPDLAFRLPEPAQTEQRTDNAQTIGLGVMDYAGWGAAGDEAIYANYIRKLTEFAKWLLAEGYRIRLLTGQPCDQRAVDDLISAVSNENGGIVEGSIIAEPQHSLHKLMVQLTEVDAVVASRFHNVLCALKVGKPTISLSYADKNDVLMSELGLGEFYEHIEHFEPDRLKQKFRELLARRNDLQETIKSRRAGLRNKLAQQEKFLIDHVI